MHTQFKTGASTRSSIASALKNLARRPSPLAIRNVRVVIVYSCRKAAMGVIFVARRAGM